MHFIGSCLRCGKRRGEKKWNGPVKILQVEEDTNPHRRAVSAILNRAFLKRDEYRDLVPLWIDKGWLVCEVLARRLAQAPEGRLLAPDDSHQWRRRFFERLNNQDKHWKDFILENVRRPTGRSGTFFSSC